MQIYTFQELIYFLEIVTLLSAIRHNSSCVPFDSHVVTHELRKENEESDQVAGTFQVVPCDLS